MSKEQYKNHKFRRGWFESGSRFGRDFNIFVGTVALAGTFIAPPAAAAALGIYAGINYAQAGGFEVARRYAKKREQKITKTYKPNRKK